MASRPVYGSENPSFFKHAFERVCVLRSLKVAVVVGSVLALINHYDAILSGTVSPGIAFQILLIYAAPYSVSTYGSAMQAKHMEMQEIIRKTGEV